jgi:sugar phosphate isomerase/epimerase
MRQLLERTAGSPLGAWLDTGHVFAQQNLGLHSIEDWLGVVGDRWLGAHLHDVVGLRDHLIPGTGAVPFAELGPRLPEDAVRTCEFDWYFAPEEVVSGAHLLVRSGCA